MYKVGFWIKCVCTVRVFMYGMEVGVEDGISFYCVGIKGRKAEDIQETDDVRTIDSDRFV